MVSGFFHAITLLLHADRVLETVFALYGSGVYAIVFFILMAETGLVVVPFLPGDSLLFAVGALCARGLMNVRFALPLLIIAAIVGDTINYAFGFRFGAHIGPLVKHGWVREQHLTRANRFFDTHGGKTIFLARFIPFLRTIAPFVAGMSHMPYRRFVQYNVFGGVVWVSIFVLSGYGFGNLPWVKDRFSLLVLAIILLSLMPVLIEAIAEKRRRG